MPVGTAIIVTCAAAAVGLVLGVWIGRRSAAAIERALDELRARAAGLEASLREKSEAAARLQAEEDRLAAETSELREARARLETELEHERKSTAEQRKLLEETETRLREAFRALSADALRESQKSFLELARSTMEHLQNRAVDDLEGRRKAVDDLVRPIEESLQKLDGKLTAVETERAGAYAALREQVSTMAGTQERLRDETTRLVQALRAPRGGGRWGEIQLRRVVEMAGMLEYCDFEEQKTVENEQARGRPDLVVHLPGGKTIVVDAKAPVDAYLEANETQDDAAREALFADHARRVKEHMSALSSKSYWKQFDSAPEFVVMFLPGEMFFSAAVRHDPTLIEYGVDRYVIPASPTTLIALLRAVHYGWQQDRVAAGAAQVRDLGRELYERLRKMAVHFDKLRKGLETAVTAYNQSVGTLERRVLVSARRFRDLGAGTTDDLPEVPAIDAAPRELQPAAEDTEASD